MQTCLVLLQIIRKTCLVLLQIIRKTCLVLLQIEVNLYRFLIMVYV
jgi:hypothetical protein